MASSWHDNAQPGYDPSVKQQWIEQIMWFVIFVLCFPSLQFIRVEVQWYQSYALPWPWYSTSSCPQPTLHSPTTLTLLISLLIQSSPLNHDQPLFLPLCSFNLSPIFAILSFSIRTKYPAHFNLLFINLPIKLICTPFSERRGREGEWSGVEQGESGVSWAMKGEE